MLEHITGLRALENRRDLVILMVVKSALQEIGSQAVDCTVDIYRRISNIINENMRSNLEKKSNRRRNVFDLISNPLKDNPKKEL